MLEYMRQHDAVPRLIHALIRGDVGGFNVQPQRLAHQFGVFREQLHAFDVPSVLPGEPQHGSVAAPQIEHAAGSRCIALDEGIGLAMAAILTRGRARSHAGQDVLLLIYAGAWVIDHQPAALAPVEFELALIALSVEQLQSRRPTELASHRTMWNAVCRRRIHRMVPSAPSSASSSCAERTAWPPHSGTGVLACSSIENQVEGSRGTSPRPGTPS